VVGGTVVAVVVRVVACVVEGTGTVVVGVKGVVEVTTCGTSVVVTPVVGIGATVVVGASVTVVEGRVVVVTGLAGVVVLRTVEGVAPMARPWYGRPPALAATRPMRASRWMLCCVPWAATGSPCPTATQRNRVIRIAVRRMIKIRRAIVFILDHGRCLAVTNLARVSVWCTGRSRPVHSPGAPRWTCPRRSAP